MLIVAMKVVMTAATMKKTVMKNIINKKIKNKKSSKTPKTFFIILKVFKDYQHILFMLVLKININLKNYFFLFYRFLSSVG